MTTADPQRAEIDLLRVEIGADPRSAELDPLQVEVDPLQVEVDLLRVEADRLSAEVDPLRAANVLIVGLHYAPEQIGYAPRSTAMARDLATIAQRVTVFTGAATDARGLLDRIGGRAGRSTHDHGVHLVRHQHHLPARAGGPARARTERSFLRAVLRTPLRDAPDLVIGVLPSAGAAVAAARIAHRFRAPLLLLVHDVVATRDTGLAGSAIARGQAEALRQATRVVLVGPGLRASVIALGIDRARIDVLADWSPSLPVKQEPATARARLGVAPDELLALYVGNVGLGQDVSTVVRAVRRIAGRAARTEQQEAHRGGTDPAGAGRRNLRMLLVGEGSQRTDLQSASADLPGVSWLDPVTAADYPGLLAAADVLVVSEPPGRLDRTLPSRLESYLRAGRPVIAAVNPGGDADRALRSVPAAVLVVPPGDSGALATALTRWRDDQPERARLRAGARGYAEAELGGAGTARGLRDVVRTALTARGR
jgi:colanic acid biosynthesis glycosyl transferase WcaI